MITNAVQRYTRPGRAVYRPVRDYFNRSEFSVESLDFTSAKEFVCKWHYSHSISAARRNFGLFQNNKLVGAAIYAHPMNDLTITNALSCERASDGLELSRVVLLDECGSNAESFFIGECHRRLKKENFAGIVSFSDDVARLLPSGEISRRGHVGIFFQALGGAFTGRGTPRTLKLLPDGTVFSDRTAQKIRAGERSWEYGSRILESFGASECPANFEERKIWLTTWQDRLTRKLSHPGNLRYVWSFSQQQTLKSLPYPKIRFSDVQMALNF